MLLGMKPLSTYDAMATPMYAAFTAKANLRPYTALMPQIEINKRNAQTAYGAALSAKLDFSRPDAIAPAVLNRILSGNHD